MMVFADTWLTARPVRAFFLRLAKNFVPNGTENFASRKIKGRPPDPKHAQNPVCAIHLP
jgi:hypothetical protein